MAMPDMDRFWQVFMALLAGMFGGLASFLHDKDKKRFKPMQLCSALVVAAFLGWAFGDIFRWVNVPEGLIAALSGICGFVGPVLLLPALAWLLGKIGIEIPLPTDVKGKTK